MNYTHIGNTINFNSLGDLYDFVNNLMNIKFPITNPETFSSKLKRSYIYDAGSYDDGIAPTGRDCTPKWNSERATRVEFITYKNEPLTIDLDGTLNFYNDSARVHLELWELEIWKEEKEVQKQEKIDNLNKGKDNDNKGYILLGLIALLPLLYVIFGGFIFLNDWEERFGHAAIGSIATVVITNNISAHKKAQKNKGTFTC